MFKTKLLFDVILQICFAFLFFYLIFDSFSNLNPNNTSWFGIDNSTSYMAQLFYLDDNWRFPLLRNPNYGGPLSGSITFTGPAPIIALFMKLFSLPPTLQLFGIWILINIFLQLFFGYQLLRFLGLDRKYARIFCIFFLSPFLILKIQQHFWLVSHYLLLWSLCIFLKSIKNKITRDLEISLVLILSYLTNIYLLAIVSAVIFTLYLVQFLGHSGNVLFWFRRFVHAFITLFLSFLIFDGVNRQENSYQSIKMYLSSTYGYHGFNILTFFNPETGFIAEGFDKYDRTIVDNFSFFNFGLGMIPGAYEGFMYLGMGVILSIFVNVLFRSSRNSFRVIELDSKQKVVLKFCLLTVMFFAVTYRIGIGSLEIILPFPELLKWPLGLFRSSGRFVWPIAYAIIAISLVTLVKTCESFHTKVRISILAVIFVFQLLDLTSPLNRQIVETSRNAESREFYVKEYVKTSKTFDGYTSIRAYPLGNVLENHYFELNYVAWELGVSTDLYFTSRLNMRKMYDRQEQTFNQICSGNLENGTLYAVSNSSITKFEGCRSFEKIVARGKFHTFIGE